MDLAERIYYRIRRYQRTYWRRQRLLFPSPAEMKLVELMGGRVVRFGFLTDPKTKFPMAFVLYRGKLFTHEKMKREKRYGPYCVDFANDLNRIIEVDGRAYHMDVVADMDREIYIKQQCQSSRYDARFLRISASELYRDPARVQVKVLQFLGA